MNFRAHAALIVVGVIYGLNYIVAKGVMPDHIAPSGFVLIRVWGATLLFWIAHRVVSNEKILREDFPLLIKCAVLGVAVNQLFFFNGLNLTSAVNASVIMTVTPVLVLAAAAAVLSERLSVQRVFGVFLGMAGALLLVMHPFLMAQSRITEVGHGLGDVLILANAATYAYYLVAVKPLMSKYQPLTVIKWIFTFGCVLVLPFGYSEAMNVEWVQLPTDILMSVAFVVVCVTFLAYFLNLYAMKSVSPSVVGIYIYLQPLLAGLISVMVQGNPIHWLQLVAAVFVFSGVYLVSIRRA